MGWVAAARRMVSAPDLGQADGPNVAGLDELADGADRLLDRDLGVEAGRPVDVDVVGAEALQAVGEAVLTAAGRAS